MPAKSNRRWFLSRRYTPRPQLRCPGCRLTYSGYHIPRGGKCRCGTALEEVRVHADRNDPEIGRPSAGRAGE
jgi:hypothetical protein